MFGHYVRVQEAARILGVSPATIRWYSLQGWLPTYRVGRGVVAHRRFRYQDVQGVAARTGRFVPDEPHWDQTVPITIDMAAQYLGLSARYLTESGLVRGGQVLSWDDLFNLEQHIYGPASSVPAESELRKEEPSMMMTEPMMEQCGCRMGKQGASRNEAGAMRASKGRWPTDELPPNEASLMVLRRAQRHLATQKADLEDQLAELERRIQTHPDNQR